MNEQFKALFESEILTDEVKLALKEAVDSYKEQIEENTKKTLEVEYAARYERDKTETNTKIINLVNEIVESEIADFRSEIEYFRGLEVKYAKKLEEFKQEYSKKLSESFETSVRTMVTEETKDLKQSILEAKENTFGKMIYEAFEKSFINNHFVESEESVYKQLEESKKQIDALSSKINDFERANVLDELLKNLSGSPRRIMETILENVPTDKLSVRYNEVLESVLNESESVKTEKDNKSETVVVTESENSNKNDPERIKRLENLRRLAKKQY